MTKFDSKKALKIIELKRKWRKYSRYVYIAVPCVLCCVLCFYFAYSKFFVSKEQAVIRTIVGDFINGDVVIGAYIDGVYSSTIPGKNGYAVEKVSCDNGSVGNWDNDKWGILVTNLTKRTKCNVYFKTKIRLNKNTKVELVQDTFEYDGTPHVPVLKKVTTEDGLDVPISDFEDTTCSQREVGEAGCAWCTKASSNFYGCIYSGITVTARPVPTPPDIVPHENNTN